MQNYDLHTSQRSVERGDARPIVGIVATLGEVVGRRLLGVRRGGTAGRTRYDEIPEAVQFTYRLLEAATWKEKDPGAG